MDIPQFIGKRLSKPCLDLAEQLPKFSGGPIARMQQDRAEQRQYAKDWHSKTRPPSGTSIRYLHFRLIQMLTAEELSIVLARIKKVIPPRDSDGEYSRVIDEPSFVSQGFHSLGTLSGPTKGQKQHRQLGRGVLPNLPPYVSWVHLAVHKVLPTVFLISADVHLREGTSAQLNNLLDKEFFGAREK